MGATVRANHCSAPENLATLEGCQHRIGPGCKNHLPYGVAPAIFGETCGYCFMVATPRARRSASSHFSHFNITLRRYRILSWTQCCTEYAPAAAVYFQIKTYEKRDQFDARGIFGIANRRQDGGAFIADPPCLHSFGEVWSKAAGSDPQDVHRTLAFLFFVRNKIEQDSTLCCATQSSNA